MGRFGTAHGNEFLSFLWVQWREEGPLARESASYLRSIATSGAPQYCVAYRPRRPPGGARPHNGS